MLHPNARQLRPQTVPEGIPDLRDAEKGEMPFAIAWLALL